MTTDLTITWHPAMPDELGMACERCRAVRGAPCIGTGQASHAERRAAWLLYLAAEGLGELSGFELWNAVLAVIEELPDAEQTTWKQRHLDELRKLSGIQHDT